MLRVHGNEAIITSKEGVVHRFYYDHCFWSFDDRHSEFAGQETVYQRLAQPLLDRSFEGYNTCLFAYGQVCVCMCAYVYMYYVYVRVEVCVCVYISATY